MSRPLTNSRGPGTPPSSSMNNGGGSNRASSRASTSDFYSSVSLGQSEIVRRSLLTASTDDSNSADDQSKPSPFDDTSTSGLSSAYPRDRADLNDSDSRSSQTRANQSSATISEEPNARVIDQQVLDIVGQEVSDGIVLLVKGNHWNINLAWLKTQIKKSDEHLKQKGEAIQIYFQKSGENIDETISSEWKAEKSQNLQNAMNQTFNDCVSRFRSQHLKSTLFGVALPPLAFIAACYLASVAFQPYLILVGLGILLLSWGFQLVLINANARANFTERREELLETLDRETGITPFGLTSKSPIRKKIEETKRARELSRDHHSAARGLGLEAFPEASEEHSHLGLVQYKDAPNDLSKKAVKKLKDDLITLISYQFRRFHRWIHNKREAELKLKIIAHLNKIKDRAIEYEEIDLAKDDSALLANIYQELEDHIVIQCNQRTETFRKNKLKKIARDGIALVLGLVGMACGIALIPFEVVPVAILASTALAAYLILRLAVIAAGAGLYFKELGKDLTDKINEHFKFTEEQGFTPDSPIFNLTRPSADS